MQREISHSKLGFLSVLVAVFALCPVRMAAAEETPSGPATPPAPSVSTRPVAAYRLRPGDEVAVSVLPRKEYDCGGVILPDGMLYLKNVGAVRAAGMTLPELSDRAYQVLNVKLVEPRVLATLVRAAPPNQEKPAILGRVTIVGAVPKAGPLDLEEGLRVRKALDLAGGATSEADLKEIAILHKDLTRTTVDLSTPEKLSDPAHNRLLLDGDSIEVRTLIVPKRDPSVRITGQVLNPGQYPLKDGMSLEDLIVAAGKLTPLARVEEVQLQRPGRAVETVDLVQRQGLGLQGKILLERGDEVFIPEHKDVVILIGAVTSPGAKPLHPGETIRDFFLSGDEKVAADLNPATVNLSEVQLIRRGQEPRKLNLSQAIRKGRPADNITLQSGDVVFLPPKKERRAGGPLQYLSQLSPLSLLFTLF